MSRHVLALSLAVAYFSLRDSLYTGSISNQNLSWKLEKKNIQIPTCAVVPALERAIFLTPSRDINLSSLSKFWFSFVRLRGSSISPVLLMAAKQYAAVRVSCHAQRKPRTSQHPMSTPRLALPARWGAGGSVVPHIHLPSVAQVSYTAVLIIVAPSTKHRFKDA